MEEPTTPDTHSTKSAFHESDIEFLRASAREWLEAVLGEELDKETSLEDLLADGAVLYRVTQHIKDDPKFPGHVESPKASTASPSFERKSSLKYQPYASVEAFLNMCKGVGLRDVDVFNPSDAVDQKDIRRVCVCLRRLSKKARTLHLLVPDFDNVKDTLVTPASKMSREAVQKTKETLQQSATRSSSKGSENGPVSSNLRKDDTETKTLEPELVESARESGNLAESFNKVHHDVAAEHKKPVVADSKSSDTSPSAAHHDHADKHSSASKTKFEAPKPTMSRIMLKAPIDAKSQADEKAKASGENQKGLFRAHLEGTAPYTKKETKKGKDGDGPWLLLGALAIAGGILGLVLWKKRGDGELGGGVKGFIERGKKKLKKFRVRNDDSSSSSSYDSSGSDSDHEGHKFPSGGVYDVKGGDNLTKIARRSGKKNWREIVVENPSIDNPNLIHPGDRLKL